MLHAHSVSFTHPVTGEHIYIEAPCPWEPKTAKKGQVYFGRFYLANVKPPRWLSRGPKNISICNS